jgi:hypothetical protein
MHCCWLYNHPSTLGTGSLLVLSTRHLVNIIRCCASPTDQSTLAHPSTSMPSVNPGQTMVCYTTCYITGARSLAGRHGTTIAGRQATTEVPGTCAAHHLIGLQTVGRHVAMRAAGTGTGDGTGTMGVSGTGTGVTGTSGHVRRHLAGEESVTCVINVNVRRLHVVTVDVTV